MQNDSELYAVKGEPIIEDSSPDFSIESIKFHEWQESLSPYQDDPEAVKPLSPQEREEIARREAEGLNEAADYVKRLKVAHVACKRELLFSTRYFFKHQYNKKFIVSDHHRQVCDVLERVLKGELTKVMINIPPRYGKTEIAVKNLVAHGLSLNASAKFIHLSYSKSLAMDNSEAIKDIVKSESYQMLFPEIKIKPKSDAKEKWTTTEGGGVYATATGGQVTGFGAGEVEHEEEIADDISDDWFADNTAYEADVYGEKSRFAGALIIDDPLKPEDADSDIKRQRVNDRFESTIRNRVNSRKTPIIIIMQRLHEEDLCGYLLKKEPDEWFVLSLPAIIDAGTDHEQALWPHKHTLEELHKQRADNEIVFERQMQQNPMPKEGLMYDTFRLYGHLPISSLSLKKVYIDSADKGKDYLCAISYLETEEAMYVTDIIYTQKPMQDTEPRTALMLSKEKAEVCRVEYNNGGGGFMRSVERQSRLLRNHKTKFRGFTQLLNKEVRIFQKANEVTNLIYMPLGWDKMFPEFYRAVTMYSKTGKNLHDDGPDTLTGMCEFFGKDKDLNKQPGWASALP